MLKPRLNPFDILNQMPSIFGTNPTPNWLLVYNKLDSTWSAADLDSVDDLLEVALNANIEALSPIEPEALMVLLTHPRPDLISTNLHNYAVCARLPARYVSILEFAPVAVNPGETEEEVPD